MGPHNGRCDAAWLPSLTSSDQFFMPGLSTGRDGGGDFESFSVRERKDQAQATNSKDHNNKEENKRLECHDQKMGFEPRSTNG